MKMVDVNTVFIREEAQARDTQWYIFSTRNFTSALG